jgi:hypothetical protein
VITNSAILKQYNKRKEKAVLPKLKRLGFHRPVIFYEFDDPTGDVGPGTLVLGEVFILGGDMEGLVPSSVLEYMKNNAG